MRREELTQAFSVLLLKEKAEAYADISRERPL